MNWVGQMRISFPKGINKGNVIIIIIIIIIKYAMFSWCCLQKYDYAIMSQAGIRE